MHRAVAGPASDLIPTSLAPSPARVTCRKCCPPQLKGMSHMRRSSTVSLQPSSRLGSTRGSSKQPTDDRSRGWASGTTTHHRTERIGQVRHSHGMAAGEMMNQEPTNGHPQLLVPGVQRQQGALGVAPQQLQAAQPHVAAVSPRRQEV